MIYPDTSFLVPLYTDEPFTEEAKEFMAADAPPLFFTPFHRLEYRTALRTRVFRQMLPIGELREAFRLCDEHLTRGILQHTPLHWPDTLREAERISEAHLTEIGARSGDLLHVACAVVLGAQDFVTFDERQNSLARRAGLKVRRWRRVQG